MQSIDLGTPMQSIDLNTPISITGLPSGEIGAFSPPKQISVAEVVDSKLKSRLRDANYHIRESAVKELERRMTIMEGKCPDDIINNLRVRVFQLDPATMREYMDQPFDHNFQDGIGCLIDALISNDLNTAVPDYNLRQWITDINQIGGTTAEGKVFNLKSGKFPLFAIKVPTNPNNDTLPHEAIVGMGAINTLRDRTSTFMHTYGAFMCAPPILDSDNRIISWCPRDTAAKKITYLVLENIVGSVGLESMAEHLTGSEFLQIYLQILNALNLAYKRFDFTHYDLHTGNVLIQRLPYPISIPFYHPNGRTLYIKTHLLARIIDYGMSHVKLEGVHFGTFGLEKYQVFPDRSFPMHDAYKLLMFTYANHTYIPSKTTYNRRVAPDTLETVVAAIYTFFSPGNLQQRVRHRLENQETDYFQLPFDEYKDRTLDQLIVHILSRINIPFLSPEQPTDTINAICQNNCISWETFNQQIFNQNQLPQTIHEYCMARTAIQTIPNVPYKQELSQWMQRFDIETAYLNERAIIETTLNIIIEHLQAIQLQFVDAPYFDLANYTTQIYQLLQLRDKFSECKIWLQELNCVLDVPDLLPIIYQDLPILFRAVEFIDSKLSEFKVTLSYNLRYDLENQLGPLRLPHQILIT